MAVEHGHQEYVQNVHKTIISIPKEFVVKSSLNAVYSIDKWEFVRVVIKDTTLLMVLVSLQTLQILKSKDAENGQMVYVLNVHPDGISI